MKFFSRLFSSTAREAHGMCRHVRKLLNEQRDLLAPKATAEVKSAIHDTETADPRDKAAIAKAMETLEKTAHAWLKPHPHPAWRENMEVLLVALTVAMGIRTFFLQPFKIPTGSMQPTLYGVNSVPNFSRVSTEEDIIEQLKLQQELKIPTGWERVRQWLEGNSYVHIVAKSDGRIEKIQPPVKFLIFSIKQTLQIGGQSYTIWFPPDYGEEPLEKRAGLGGNRLYRAGEEVVKLKVQAGDHLFVDRLTYNFRPPKRGEIIVFETRDIPPERRDNRPYWFIPADQFYIKRLVALGGEQVQIGADRHLIIDGERLDASTPHFENIYSFDPKEPPQDSQYSGHVNTPGTAPYFSGQPAGVRIPPDHYMVMGDNTMNSLDSRAWGEFPSSSVIGKAFFVYWPLTPRFGWGQQ